jgi:hypothetical protein
VVTVNVASKMVLRSPVLMPNGVRVNKYFTLPTTKQIKYIYNFTERIDIS